MPETVNSLTLQFLEWLDSRRRTYAEVMGAWRSSCPRLTIWEDAIEDGLIPDRERGRAESVRGGSHAAGEGPARQPWTRITGMTDHYHDKADLGLLKDMAKLAPEEFKAWANLDGIVGREGGRIPRKYRELIAIAVAHTTQCVYCIEVHTKAAKKAGASREAVVEAVLLAAALRAGGAAAHGTLALKFHEQA